MNVVVRWSESSLRAWSNGNLIIICTGLGKRSLRSEKIGDTDSLEPQTVDSEPWRRVVQICFLSFAYDTLMPALTRSPGLQRAL